MLHGKRGVFQPKTIKKKPKIGLSMISQRENDKNKLFIFKDLI